MSYTLNESIAALTSISQRFQTATPENPITGQEVSDFGNHIKNVLNLLAVSDIQTSQVTTLLEVAKTSNLQKDLEQSLDIDALKNLTTLLEVAKAENLQKDATQDAKDAQHDAALTVNANVNATQSSEIATLQVIRKDGANVFYVDRQYTTQAEMIAQDTAALQGVSNRPFATPYSAKKAAIAYLQANPAKEAVIEIARGNTFTSADYIASEQAVTVSMGGVDYVSGVELCFHGITYYLEGSKIETPIMNAAFLAAQSDNGLSLKKAVFCGGKYQDMGFNSHAQANIWFYGVERGAASPSRHADRFIAGDVGIKYFEALDMPRGLQIGDKWHSAGTGFTRVLETIKFLIGKSYSEGGTDDRHNVMVTKLHNKNLIVTIAEAEVYRTLLNLGHFSGVANDGTLGGIEDSTVTIAIEVIVPTDYVYLYDIGGGFINITNNKTSTLKAQLCDLGTLTVPKLLWAYGIQEQNKYHFKDAKVKIDNPTSVEMPFHLALDTSVLVLENWDIESNVNSPLFAITSGKMILRNCKIKQSANQQVFNISAGATVVLENTHIVGKQLVSTGSGKIISKKSTANVPVGTAVLRGDLAISKFYDESLNQTELSFANNMATFEHGTQWFEIPNPNQLRIAVSETVSVPFGETVSIQHSGRTLEINNTKTVVDENGATHNVVSLFMQQATAPNESKVTVPYELVPTDYILGV